MATAKGTNSKRLQAQTQNSVSNTSQHVSSGKRAGSVESSAAAAAPEHNDTTTSGAYDFAYANVDPDLLIKVARAKYHARKNLYGAIPKSKELTAPTSAAQSATDFTAMGFPAQHVKTMQKYKEPEIDSLAQATVLYKENDCTVIGKRVFHKSYEPLHLYPTEQDLADWVLHDHSVGIYETTGREATDEERAFERWMPGNRRALIFNLTTHSIRITADLGVLYGRAVSSTFLGPRLSSAKSGYFKSTPKQPATRPIHLPKGMGGPMLRQEIAGSPTIVPPKEPESEPEEDGSDSDDFQHARTNMKRLLEEVEDDDTANEEASPKKKQKRTQNGSNKVAATPAKKSQPHSKETEEQQREATPETQTSREVSVPATAVRKSARIRKPVARDTW